MPYQIKDPGKDLYIMEFCGTHTMAIARAGLRQCLPSHVHLVSGPGNVPALCDAEAGPLIRPCS